MIFVLRNGEDIERILKRFNRSSQPLLRELKYRSFFETKSERRKRKDRAAETRRRKKEKGHEGNGRRKERQEPANPRASGIRS
jgi:ribosomal protein S21